MSAPEQIVLGAMLAAPGVLDDVLDILTSGDFADTRHGEIYAAITAAHAAGTPMIPWAGLLLAVVSAWAMQALMPGNAPGDSDQRAVFIATWLLGIATAITRSHRRPDGPKP